MEKMKEAKAILEGKLAVSTFSVSVLFKARQSEQTSPFLDLNRGPTIGFCIESVVGVVSPL